MKQRAKFWAAAAVLAAAAAAVIIFFCTDITFSPDQKCNTLIEDIIPRAALSAAFIALALLCGFSQPFTLKKENFARNLVWCLPCMAVVAANFPFSALISGDAVVERPDLIWLFLIKCLLIALSEEALFRGFLMQAVAEYVKDRKYSYVLTVVISSAAFALFHLLNLFAGAGVGATLLQTGYTFLTGMMFAAVTCRTGGIWAAVGLHFVFDVGGLLITDLGSGNVHDACFWVLTAIAAVVCAAHLAYDAVKKYLPEQNNEKQP